MEKKILKKKIKKNTILSVFDNIQDKPITLLKWIKSIYKECKIERIEVQNANTENDYGFILVFYFLDGSTLSTPLIRVATQEVLDQIVQELSRINERIDTEINDRELADSELQHDIDNHTANKSNPHETTFTNLLNIPTLITRVEQIDNSLYLYYVGVDTPFIYTPNIAGGVAWGNITGLLADQTDLAEVLQSLQQSVDSKASQSDLDAEVQRATSEEGRIEGLINEKQNKLYLHKLSFSDSATYSSVTYNLNGNIYILNNNNTEINTLPKLVDNRNYVIFTTGVANYQESSLVKSAVIIDVLLSALLRVSYSIIITSAITFDGENTTINSDNIVEL